jgi:hypothetical protein
VTEFDDLPPELPGWPKVVGILSICIGGFWLLCGGCGLAQVFVGGMFQPPPEVLAKMPPPELTKPGLGPMVMLVAGMGMSTLLLVAGILTVRRGPVGRILHLVYASISIPMMAVSMFLHFQHQVPIQKWISENPDHPGLKQAQMIVTIGTGVAVVLTALNLAYVVFLLIWFGAVKRKGTDMGVVPKVDYV